MQAIIRAFLRAPGSTIGLILVLMLIIISVFAPILLGAMAAETDLNRANEGPSREHIFGTDQLGRSIFARTLVATRLSLSLALLSVSIGSVLGLPFGAMIGLVRNKKIHNLGSRAVDAFLAFPPILVALFIAAIFGPGQFTAVLAIGIALAPGLARLAGTLASSVGAREYINAARVVGITPGRLLFRYILPNIAEPLTVSISTFIGVSLIAVSALSFLGLGVQAPAFDWGRLLAEGIRAIYITPLSALAPAFFITVSGLAFGFIGESVARALNPLLWTQLSESNEGRKTSIYPSSGKQTEVSIVKNKGEAVMNSCLAGIHEPLLRVCNLTVKFPDGDGSIKAVAGVSFEIVENEIVGIVGESGSGKTMTALAIARLVPYPGKVSADVLQMMGQDLQSLKPWHLNSFLGKELAFIFQDPMSSLNPALRIRTQLTESSCVHRSLNRKEALTLAIQRMRDVRINTPELCVNQYPHEFSGGMRQRTMIAMSLMNQPSLIIADEPTTALDKITQAQIMDILAEINRVHGSSIILISHDIGLISEICSRVLVMYAGRIVEDITVEELLKNPAHPYTKALMAMVPNMDTDRTCTLQTIPGSSVGQDDMRSGCSFASRCIIALERCGQEQPYMIELGKNHRVECWRMIDTVNERVLSNEKYS